MLAKFTGCCKDDGSTVPDVSNCAVSVVRRTVCRSAGRNGMAIGMVL